MTKLIKSDEFLKWLGIFHAVWATNELTTCYAIGALLKISDKEAHILTAGMEFGRKAALLRNLVYHSDLANKRAINKALDILRNEIKRNVFAHGFLLSSEHSVTFIDRSRGGDYAAVRHKFTLDSFSEHVEKMVDAGNQLEKALNIPQDRLGEFALAALRVSAKSNKSPDPPFSKA